VDEVGQPPESIKTKRTYGPDPASTNQSPGNSIRAPAIRFQQKPDLIQASLARGHHFAIVPAPECSGA
jgi:hypothetical protein